MGKWIHRLSNINTENKTAICLECGLVDIEFHNNTPKCMNRIRQYRYGIKGSHGIAPKYCEVCGRGDLPICLDHNHVTGEVRGWLCRNCNAALGLLQDNKETLSKLISYLK